MAANALTVAELDEEFAAKYRIRTVLGEGGMGVVVDAFDLQLERDVAIKLIRSELVQHDEMSSRFLAEARAAAKIRSEHVARVLDVGRLASGAPYIVMERLEGQDLAKFLAESGALPEDLAIEYLLQACEAIAEAHWHQIIHRDLKPENLFLSRGADGDFRIKVLDFGISKNVRTGAVRLTAPQAIVGSPIYMAPEQMNPSAEVDARADVYSLGAILFEMLCARPVFEGETLASVCHQVVSVAPPRVSELARGVSPQVADVIERCLSKTRGDRPNDVGELAATLAKYGTSAARRSAERIARIAKGGRFTTPLSMRDAVTDRPHARSEIQLTQATAQSAPPNKRRVVLGLGALSMVSGLTIAWVLNKPSWPQASEVTTEAEVSAPIDEPPPKENATTQAVVLQDLAPKTLATAARTEKPSTKKLNAREPRSTLNSPQRPSEAESSPRPANDSVGRDQFGGRN
ncbi:MAG: hypothetical protein RJA70_4465 [Pseudomonadota bacterium]|jgi:serine/threonine-protein kinase